MGWMMTVMHIQLQFVTYIGGLAQMVERALRIREVGRWILSFSTMLGFLGLSGGKVGVSVLVSVCFVIICQISF